MAVEVVHLPRTNCREILEWVDSNGGTIRIEERAANSECGRYSAYVFGLMDGGGAEKIRAVGATPDGSLRALALTLSGRTHFIAANEEDRRAGMKFTRVCIPVLRHSKWVYDGHGAFMEVPHAE